MDRLRYFAFTWIFLWLDATAQVPQSGRWQELRFSADEVHARSASNYYERVSALAAGGQLDDLPAIKERVQRIATTIIGAAKKLQPAARDWEWEVHTTSNPAIDAFCMAGGKILIGSNFIQRLALNDGELAALIGHEVAHAIAEHHRETLSEALSIVAPPTPSLAIVMARLDLELTLQIRLFSLASIQESEADQLGMTLAHLAGWNMSDVVSFYQKLLDTEVPSLMSASHPPPAARLGMAKIMALLLPG